MSILYAIHTGRIDFVYPILRFALFIKGCRIEGIERIVEEGSKVIFEPCFRPAGLIIRTQTPDNISKDGQHIIRILLIKAISLYSKV